MRIDIHQHLWTAPLIEALTRREELPFVREERGLTMLYLAGERPYVIDLDAEAPTRRAAQVRADGMTRALVCLSSPIGAEWLPRAQASELVEAYLDGALALGEPFGVWGAMALEGLDPDDVDRMLERGCVGVSLPAGALANVAALTRVAPILERLEGHGAPLFVHPGPAASPPPEASLTDPLWWPALTRYVAGMQAAWLAFVTAGRRLFAGLRVVFAMLAGQAPLHAERLRSRGGQATLEDPLLFYETSSYGRGAVEALERQVGAGQLVYGTDRPVVDASRDEELDRAHLALNSARALERATRRRAGLTPAGPTLARSRPITRLAVLGRAV